MEARRCKPRLQLSRAGPAASRAENSMAACRESSQPRQERNMALSSTITVPPTKTGGEADVAACRLSPSPRDRTIPADLVEDDFLIPLVDVARHINAYVEELARGHGITRAQLIIIARLERRPEVSQDELAAFAEVAPPTIALLI